MDGEASVQESNVKVVMKRDGDVSVDSIVHGESVDNSENATPLSLDAIPTGNQVVKTSEQEVINMLLAQHGIIPNSGSLDVTAFNTQHSPTLRAGSVVSENSDETDPKEIILPTMVGQSGNNDNIDGTQEVVEGVQSADLNQNAEQVEASNAYLSTLNASEIVTTFVADDGQGGHIIISGPDYQDSGVVTMTGQQVSRVTEGQLMTIASGENVPVSIAALDSYSTDHVRIAPCSEGDDGGTTTSYYVLDDHVAMVDGQSHLATSDPEVSKKVYQCTMEGCGKQFSTPYRLKAHGRSHTGQTFTCEEDGCHKTFITNSDLNKHSRTHTGDKPFYCEFEGCGKVYSTAHHLKVHKRSHTGDKPFICKWETCGKSFSTGYGLKSHFRTHTGERPYKCPEDACDKAFKTSGDLQKHVRTHTGERPFKCPYDGCERSFTTSNIRKVHLRTHTGERPYVCEIEGCNRSFASATNYKNHSRIHTGERPYACEVPGCNKSFTEYSSLYKHNVVHTQQKPYICNICHKTYRQTSTLAMHKRTVHGTSEDGLQENDGEDGEDRTERPPASKRQKLSFDSNASSLTTAMVQGLPVLLNDEGTMSALQSHYAELAAQQQLAEGSALSGAIAIPIQVTMNPDGTISGAHGINLTDNSGRLIPVSLSFSLPNSMATSNSNDSIATSEAAAAASAVHEIFSSQQTQPTLDVQLSTGQVITEPIENTELIKDDHSDTKDSETEGLGGQILITAVSDTHVLMASDSDATSVRIAPRDYAASDAGLKNKDDDVTAVGAGANGSAVSMIIGEDVEQEHEEGDVTDRYLIKESDVKDKTEVKTNHNVLQ